MLDMGELLKLEEVLRKIIDERLEAVLTKLNRTGELGDFLKLFDAQELLGEKKTNALSRDGKIIVIGSSEVEREKLSAVAKTLGIDKERFEFYLDYEDAKTFDFKKTQWSSKYSCILVGQMPHSGNSKGDYSSIITALESQEGYPPIVRMGLVGLKITKTSFRESLNQIIENRIVAVA